MKGSIFTKSLAVVLLFAVLAFGLASPAQAFTPRADDWVVIQEDEVIHDDLYVGGNEIIIKGKIEGDLIAAGTLIRIEKTGVVEGDLIAAAQGVIVAGTVGGDARIAGMSLVVEQGAQIGEDLLAFGYSLDMQSQTTVGQDLVIGAGSAALNGDVIRNINAGVNGLEINGTVGGSVTAEVGDGETGDMPMTFMRTQNGVPDPLHLPAGLTVSPDASIAGDLYYTGAKQGSVAESAVSGKTTYNPVTVQATGSGNARPEPVSPLWQAASWLVDLLRTLAALLLIGFILSYFFPDVLREGADTLQSQPLPSLGWGIVSYIGFFLLVFLLIGVVAFAAVVLGIITLGDLVWTTLGIGALAFTSLTVSFHIASSYVSKVLVGYMVGRWLLGQFRPELGDNRFWPAVIGIVLFTLAASVPWVGWIVNLLVVLFGLGALFLMLRKRYTGRKEPALVLQPQA